MKKLFLITTSAFMLNVATVKAQINLVPNPSFEEKVACPSGLGLIDSAKSWITIRNTPNYFNSCSPSLDYSVPNNSFGFQYPPSVNCSAYAGFYSYTYPFQLAREYFGARLDSALNVGSKYFISLKTVRASGQLRASNNIGVLFTTQQSHQEPSAPMKNLSHVNSSDVITDTLNWTTVFGSFIADSSYAFIEVGNFYDDSNTMVTANNALAYYFIDDICVSTDSLFCATYNYICNVDIEEYYKQNLLLYPNPTAGLVFFNTEEQLLIKVYNLQGNELFEANKPANNSIDISSIPSGIYFIRIFFPTQIINSKIVIIH